MKTNTMRILILGLLSLLTTTSNAQIKKIYAPEDSVRIETLLKEGMKQPKETNLMLYYGMQFIGVPYVAYTLETTYVPDSNDATEQLIINTRQIDCTTFVETVATLSKTTKLGQTSFSDYCDNLIRFRYKDGIMKDYSSRNHYFTSWIDNAVNLDLATEIKGTSAQGFKSRVQNIDYKTKHNNQYAALKNHNGQRYLPTIAQAEMLISRRVYYLPTSLLGKSEKELPFVQNGDILALETTKEGLDVSHIGIAVWGKDGKLHLLNASSIHKKVVLESLPLVKYQQWQRTQIGIRIIRPD